MDWHKRNRRDQHHVDDAEMHVNKVYKNSAILFTCIIAVFARITRHTLADILVTRRVAVCASRARSWAARTFRAVVPTRARYAGGIL